MGNRSDIRLIRRHVAGHRCGIRCGHPPARGGWATVFSWPGRSAHAVRAGRCPLTGRPITTGRNGTTRQPSRNGSGRSRRCGCGRAIAGHAGQSRTDRALPGRGVVYQIQVLCDPTAVICLFLCQPKTPIIYIMINNIIDAVAQHAAVTRN